MNHADALHDRAVALLRALSGPHGIHASLSEAANYRAVFTRDAVMAGIAGMLIGDGAISTALGRTLERLRELQGAEGQIASNYVLEADGTWRTSFGTLAPRLDAPLWYLVGVATAVRAGVVSAAAFRDSVRATVRLLDALEYNGRDLIYMPMGGDWADEYVYDGYILSDQVLRAWGLRLVADCYGEPRWAEKAARIARAIDANYGGGGSQSARHPAAAFSPGVVRDQFDLAACSLLGVAGIATDTGTAALDWISERFLERGQLPPAFHPVIDEQHPDWPALRRYHAHGFRNQPHEYHNGGIWPIWLGWLALAFARSDRANAASRLRSMFHAHLAALPDFEFEEYLHGRTGIPGGVRQMAYSATGVVLIEAVQRQASLGLLSA